MARELGIKLGHSSVGIGKGRLQIRRRSSQTAVHSQEAKGSRCPVQPWLQTLTWTHSGVTAKPRRAWVLHSKTASIKKSASKIDAFSSYPDHDRNIIRRNQRIAESLDSCTKIETPFHSMVEITPHPTPQHKSWFWRRMKGLSLPSCQT